MTITASLEFRGVFLTLLALAVLVAPVELRASCRSSHCGLSTSLPTECAQRAQVRAPLVMMTGSFGSFRFEPQDPRIEPGDCIEWMSGSVTHSSSADNCADLSNAACDAASPDPNCKWETGNVSVSGVSVFCFYDALRFLSDTSEGYYCRPHSSPSHSGTMFGTLRVTRAIVLTVTRAGDDVELGWSGGDGGGVSIADRRFQVVRSTDDPNFSGVLENFTPSGGVAGTSYTDLGEAANTNVARFYLVLHRQATE